MRCNVLWYQNLAFIMFVINSSVINSVNSKQKSVEPEKLCQRKQDSTLHTNVEIRTKVLTRDTNNTIKTILKLESMSRQPRKVSRVARKLDFLPNYAPSIIAPISPSEVVQFTVSETKKGRSGKYVSPSYSSPYSNSNSNYKRTATNNSCSGKNKTVKTQMKLEAHNDESYPTLNTMFVNKTIDRKLPKNDPTSNLKRQANNVTMLIPDEENIIQSSGTTTTVSDKVKFFEMYDTNTVKTLVAKVEPFYEYKRQLNNNTKEEISNKTEQHITKKELSKKLQHENSVNQRKQAILQAFFVINNKTNTTIEKTNSRMNTMYSRIADWYKYSFTGAYINEPANIQCDAAAISPHWLIASGSCLSTNKIPPSGGRSAFVAYCGADLKRPGRLNYVKHTMIHPKYRLQDNDRILLYNVGLIRVLTPMSTCSGWAPIGFTSYHFFTPEDGSRAIAIGWGLDRYTSNSYLEKQKLPLKEYGSLIYSNLCPGSMSYSKLENLEAKKYLYCLTLPPYRGENNDPVHGGLLLYEGNIIALYLKEERRPEGIQSAQYTGIWRALPWITEVAQESEDMDKLIIDMV